jgi:antitoxin Phd
MKEVTARDAKNQFGQLLDLAQREPVRVTKHGRAAGVLLSEDQYQRLRGAAWEHLGQTVAAMRAEAAEKGLTEKVLADLLEEPFTDLPKRLPKTTS